MSTKTKKQTKEILDWIDNAFRYDHQLDTIVWKRDANTRGIKAGTPIKGSLLKNGYVHVNVNIAGRPRVKYHHLVWYLVYGEWPAHQIDHINCIRNDNRIANLRQATHQQNMHNKKNKKMYWWKPRISKYEACIRQDGKRHYVGVFRTEAEAKKAIQIRLKELRGEFCPF